jgi:hypothetical protein
MIGRATIAERAFQLARSGDCANVREIKKRLKAEGYERVEAHIAGSTIVAPLVRLCVEAQARKMDMPPPGPAAAH